MKIRVLLPFLLVCLFVPHAVLFAADVSDPPKPPAAVAVAPTGPAGQTRAPGSLTTIFNGVGGAGGNMFDITTTRPLRITGLDVNTEPAGQQVSVNVYWRPGTSVGFENSSAGWIRLDSGVGTTAGGNLPTYIDLPGATQSFPPGSYGLYVSINEWPTIECAKTNGGPNTYSNSDLSIVTNCSKYLPEFTGPSFFYRIWNGTIYYDDGGPDLPTADIKCNGLENGVTMVAGTNARLDYNFHAGVGAGVGVDLWLALDHPIGFFTYDGTGPYMGWNLGFGSAFHTGPLADMNGTCLDFPLGVGSYKAHAAIETNANGVLDLGSLFARDVVDFDVTPAPRIYKWDDGSTENLLAWTSGGEICWLNMWDAYAGGETIVDVQCIFGSVMYPGYAPGNGTACQAYVWDDPTDDGDPSDCALVTTENIAVAQVDTDLYNVFPLTAPAMIAKQFYVGCNMPHAVGEYCMPMDQDGTYVPGASWYCGTNTPPFDPNNLMNNQYTPAEYGVFNCIRAGY